MVDQLPDSPEGVPHASLEGVMAVETDHGTIYVPADCTDEVVRYETPDGEKHEWVNPDAPEPTLTDPGPDDDVIYDAAVHGYVPRVRAEVTEAGGGADHATVR